MTTTTTTTRPTVRTPVVEFSRKGAPASPDGDVVRVRGVIFRSGDYPEKAFRKTPDDLRRDVAEFAPVPIDLGHPSAPSPLDGQFGELESVDLSDDGTTMYGTVAFQKWAWDKLRGARLRVSASWDRATQRMRALSLVTNPHIEDAELMAAFCACHPEAAPAATITKAKERTMPETNDLTDDERRLLEGYRATPTGERAGILSVLEGTYEEPDQDDEDDDDDQPAGDEPGPTPAEFARQQAEIEELKAKDRRRDAEVFVDAAIKDSLVLPAERARLVARHAQFSLDDQTAPAQFSDGKVLSRVAEFEADIRGRKAHDYTRDRIPARGGHVLPNDAEFSGETPEQRRARLDRRLENTSTGRAILARRNGHGAGAARV